MRDLLKEKHDWEHMKIDEVVFERKGDEQN